MQEAGRRGVEPDAFVDELLRKDLSSARADDLGCALDSLAAFRAEPPLADAVALVRDGRAALEARTY